MVPPVTLRDVTRVAGVHPGTVSRALNDDTRALVSEETARWDHFASALDAQMPPRASKARAWALLARTAFSPPGRKYDSVRMVARSNW